MIRAAAINDCRTLAELAVQMWSNSSVNKLEADFSEMINKGASVCFIKYSDNSPIGFAQCSLRHDYVEGTSSSPVGYLEGVFIKNEYRNKGYGKELVLACEEWAKNMGCREFASDCELTNADSLKFHLSMGFNEENRIICFRKDI